MTLTIAELLKRVAELPDSARPAAISAARDIYGSALEVALDAPPRWRTDLVDGHGNAIAAPPSLDEFVVSQAFLGQPRFKPRQESFLRRGISFDPALLFRRRKSVHTLIALWGKGSGKDWLCSVVLAWVCFVVNSMEDPWGYMNHAPGDPFDLVNIATNSAQAKGVFFNKLKGRIRRPCFDQFHGSINSEVIEFHRSLTPGGLPTVLLQCHSLHAQNESWEGKSLLFWVMDEADAFQDESGNSNADACYLTLSSSAGSRFGSRYIGLIISFRRVADGFMDRMQRVASDEPEQYVFDEGATWDIRPEKSRNDPEIASHYRIDPMDAACKYENIAPPTIGGFFTLPARLDACVDPVRRPICDAIPWESVQVQPAQGRSQHYVALRLENWRLDDDATRRTYFIHGDPGHTDASFAVSLCHVEVNRGVSRGLPLSSDATYFGDELRDSRGEPMPGKRVVYFGPNGTRVGGAVTDREGRHALWLLPGTYSYAFYDSQGLMIRHERDHVVSAGVEMTVEDMNAAPDPVTGLATRSRVVFPVVEDLLLEWKPSEGKPVDYSNVEETLMKICALLPVQQVSFDKFNSVQLVHNLRAKGINAIDMSFSNPVQMAIFRNLRQMVYAGLVSFLGGPPESVEGRALRQLKRLRNRGNVKVEPPDNEWKDLADARGASVYFACILSEGMMTASDAAAGSPVVWSIADLRAAGGKGASNSPLARMVGQSS